jgi:hypothetical protein
MLGKWAKKIDVVMCSIVDIGITEARNMISEFAREQKCTHIFFLKSDKLLRENVLPCLLTNHDAAVVAASVAPPFPTGMGNKQEGTLIVDGKEQPLNLPLDGKSYAVDTCSMDCTLVKTSIFEWLDRPYFLDGHQIGHMKIMQNVSSASNFCRKVRENGGIVRIETRAIVGQSVGSKFEYPRFLTGDDVPKHESPVDPTIGVNPGPLGTVV